ncbi:unnamed protein product [Trifolium pratense]|uniref:Uncharacterized protein n=1 Tax=Trifolium pratense TaxID=57577 RepID=A0ACB0K996_TRIPR|nr:unnamed protein product [Trifolium pratense]
MSDVKSVNLLLLVRLPLTGVRCKMGFWPDVKSVFCTSDGVEIEGECSGYLCVKSSWPGAFRTLYGDHERYETTYLKPFAGYYFSGDGCSRALKHVQFNRAAHILHSVTNFIGKRNAVWKIGTRIFNVL